VWGEEVMMSGRERTEREREREREKERNVAYLYFLFINNLIHFLIPNYYNFWWLMVLLICRSCALAWKKKDGIKGRCKAVRLFCDGSAWATKRVGKITIIN